MSVVRISSVEKDIEMTLLQGKDFGKWYSIKVIELGVKKRAWREKKIPFFAPIRVRGLGLGLGLGL